MKNNIKLILLVSILILPILLGILAQSVNNVDDQINWKRTGGVISLDEELIIKSDGSVTYNSSLFGNGNLVLTENEYKEIIIRLNDFFIKNLEENYQSKPNTADYFQYQIDIIKNSGNEKVVWVDNWAAEKTIPIELKIIQNNILSIIERIHTKIGSSDNVEQITEDIAKEFIIQAPTFKFDGIIDTLKVQDIKILESFPVQYIITITFDSAHAGYGDRSDQFVATVITPHTAEVTIVNYNIVSATLDEKWDEQNQKET